jgi:hypothetical protein
MNDKQAKKLRRLVESWTGGDGRNRRYLVHNRTGVRINHPDSARGRYLALKKEYARGTNIGGT